MEEHYISYSNWQTFALIGGFFADLGVVLLFRNSYEVVNYIKKKIGIKKFSISLLLIGSIFLGGYHFMNWLPKVIPSMYCRYYVRGNVYKEAGDCYFLFNKYNLAEKNYQKCITASRDYLEYDYYSNIKEKAECYRRLIKLYLILNREDLVIRYQKKYNEEIPQLIYSEQADKLLERLQQNSNKLNLPLALKIAFLYYQDEELDKAKKICEAYVFPKIDSDTNGTEIDETLDTLDYERVSICGKIIGRKKIEEEYFQKAKNSALSAQSYYSKLNALDFLIRHNLTREAVEICEKFKFSKERVRRICIECAKKGVPFSYMFIK
jgi:tetratricopeptide (TPR) repeat protein